MELGAGSVALGAVECPTKLWNEQFGMDRHHYGSSVTTY